MRPRFVALVVLMSAIASASEVATRPEDYTVAEIWGTCMVPLLKNGQLVLVDHAVKFDEVKVGEVITFRFRGRVYAHRVIAIRTAGNGEKYFTTKGDNVSPRETVTQADFIGRIETE